MLMTLGGGGEAHLWSAGHGVVSVDLGHAKTGERAARAHPRVVVLTHSDQDHINGAGPFFAVVTADKLPCGLLHELWMPYEWAVLVDVFGQVATNGVDADDVRRIEDLAESVGDAVEERPDGASRSGAEPVQWADPLTAEAGSHIDAAEGDDVNFHEGTISNVARALSGALAAGTIEAHYSPSDRDVEGVAKDITKKAVKLGRILLDARSAEWRIRWFSTDHTRARSWMSSREPGLVTISNAQEVQVHRAPANGALLLRSAQLTVQNRRALAPYLWGRGPAGDAVIWSDGDGGGERNLRDFPWYAIGVMSAPHHGSRNAAHHPIWDSVLRSGRMPYVIRTGGSKRQTPHPLLRQLPAARSRSTRSGRGFRPGDAIWWQGAGFHR